MSPRALEQREAGWDTMRREHKASCASGASAGSLHGREGREQGADCELTDLLSLFTRVGRKPRETGPSLCTRPQGKLCLLASHPASSSLTCLLVPLLNSALC